MPVVAFTKLCTKVCTLIAPNYSSVYMKGLKSVHAIESMYIFSLVDATKYKVESTEYRVQSTEYRVQSTESAAQESFLLRSGGPCFLPGHDLVRRCFSRRRTLCKNRPRFLSKVTGPSQAGTLRSILGALT